MVIGIGIDVIEIGRVAGAIGRQPRFLEKVYTVDETDQCLKKGRPESSFAARFAAKEAVFKSLGGGWSLGWLSVEIIADPAGQPQVRLHGRAEARAEELGVREIKVSLTHSRQTACAVAIALGG
jgi:holo-[acyl-carrier protein] synthase